MDRRVARGKAAVSIPNCSRLSAAGLAVVLVGCRWHFDDAAQRDGGGIVDGNVVLDDAGNPVTCAVDTDCGRCQRCSNMRCERATFLELGLGGNNGCAVDELGEVWCWGLNSYLIVDSELSGMAITPRPRRRVLPYTVEHLGVGWGVIYMTTPARELHSRGTTDGNVDDTSTQWERISVNHFSACALTPGNAIYCSGIDEFGQLGRGTTNTAAQPLGQFGTTSDWLSVAPGNTTCAIKQDHTLWCVGENDFGQLARGTTSTGETALLQVGTDTDWATVDVGSKHVCATKQTGTLWCWGVNLVTGGMRTMPLQIGLAMGWTGLDSYFRCSTAQRGGVAYWTCGDARDLAISITGNATFDWTPLPITPDPGTRVELGAESACAKSNGNWICWGDNRNGSVGVDDLAVVGATPLCQ